MLDTVTAAPTKEAARWTLDEERQLIEMAMATPRMSVEGIAIALDRSESAVVAHMSRLRIKASSWTQHDDDVLTSLLEEYPEPTHQQLLVMAGELDRHVNAVRMRVRAIQSTPKRGAKLRQCINKWDCGRIFFSSGPGERICPTCKRNPDYYVCA
ncbi:hypothetical protein WHZ77_06005 [Bradyrhizobium sp. A5]|uniref:hypothetical protein n=1 Tax=Bradyrhizobium sp. A5 TaxID=3133696 RepID=UPI003244D3E9